MKRSPTPDRPSTIPFEPIPENRERLERWFVETFAGSAFNTCTHQPLQGMTGVPMKTVKKRPGTDHPKAYTPIPVAFHFKKQVKKDLDRDVRLGIIEPVPQGEVGEWCSCKVLPYQGHDHRTRAKPTPDQRTPDHNKTTEHLKSEHQHLIRNPRGTLTLPNTQSELRTYMDMVPNGDKERIMVTQT